MVFHETEAGLRNEKARMTDTKAKADPSTAPDSPIAVGDLVIVVRGHCVHALAGAVRAVESVIHAQGGDYCYRRRLMGVI